LGYELMNEPWAGDVYANPKNLLPHYAEEKYLQPMYEYIHKAIRTVDDEKIIFFEGLTIDYWPNGFTAGPGGADYNDRQAFAYHIYCPLQDPTAAKEVVCEGINAEFLAMRRTDAERMGTAMIMTEFGAAEDTTADIFALEKNVELADKFRQSWMYWQFKYFEDLTTCTPLGESMYDESGEICTNKLTVLSRTYPQATAGAVISYDFNTHTAEFNMQYTPRATVSSTDAADSLTTQIYYNSDLFYAHGIKVELSGSASTVVNVVCPKLLSTTTVLSLVQTASVPSDVTDGGVVNVKVSKCLTALDDSCTCK